VLQVIPNPSETLAEMARVLRSGGRLAVMVPTVGPATALFRLLPTLEDLGLVDVRAKTLDNFQWVRGKRH
jgi:arsenite methyltransferase